MKKILVLLTSLLFVGTLAYADHHEKESSASVETSTNPLTGTKTTKKKTKKKSQEAGGEQSAEMTETVKEKKDGTTTKSVDVEKESETKKK